MRPTQADIGIALVCLGSRSETNAIAVVSPYHCENPGQKEILAKNLGSGIIHVLQTPEPIGTYVQSSAAAALASKGIRNDPQSPKKLVLRLERFDYDERSDHGKTGGVMFPWQAFSDHGGIVRKGFLDTAVKVLNADGTTAYERRVSVEVSRKRGQLSSGVLLASVAIAQVSPIAPNPEAVREKEEKTVTADVLSDLFAKFQDELAADDDLLRAIRK